MEKRHSLDLVEMLKVEPEHDSERHQVGQLRQQTAKQERETRMLAESNLQK